MKKFDRQAQYTYVRDERNERRESGPGAHGWALGMESEAFQAVSFVSILVSAYIATGHSKWVRQLHDGNTAS